MIKLLKLTSVLIVLTGCKKSESSAVSLSVKNSEIYFLGEDSIYGVYSYMNNSKRYESENVITYTISNNTDKKLLFAFDKDELHPTVKDEEYELGFLGFRVLDDDSTALTYSMPLVSWRYPAMCALDTYVRNDSILKAKYKRLGVNPNNARSVDNFIVNSTVLYPNESKTFKVILSLPIVKEGDSKFNRHPVYYQNLQDEQTFHLLYSCDGVALNKILPKYLQEELKSNDIEIFDGIVFSNGVKLTRKDE